MAPALGDMKYKSNKSKWLQLNKPLIIFSVLVLYIFASFIWWSYLLISNTANTMEQSKKLLVLQYENEGIAQDEIVNMPSYLDLEKNYRNQVLMVLGEGLVFLVLLSAAIIQIWRSYKQELALANQQRNFLLSITHELKSPLASIKLGLETINKRELDKEKFQKMIDFSLSDTNRLQNLVEDILLAAKFEDHSFQFVKSPLDLSEFVGRMIAKMRSRHPDRKFNFSHNGAHYIKGDRQALTSLVSNILENAVKYSPEGSDIDIEVENKYKSVVMAIKDKGIGIAEHEKPNIFKKFYRVGNEDTRKSKGTGLGLFIVKEVADGHQARIYLEPNTPAGTVFKVLFPPDDQES